MNMDSFLQLYEKLEALLRRLPAALHKPVLNELSPLKELFLMQRPPRIVLAGAKGTGKLQLLNALLGAETTPSTGEECSPALQSDSSGWTAYARTGRGCIRVLDATGQQTAALPEKLQMAMTLDSPDIVLFLWPADMPVDELNGPAEQCAELLRFCKSRHGFAPGVIGVFTNVHLLDEYILSLPEIPPPHTPHAIEAARLHFHASLASVSGLREHLISTLPVSTLCRYRRDGSIDPASDRRYNINKLAQLLAMELPHEAKLDMARISGAKEAQAEIAQTLTKSMSAICGAVGTQPIPLADLPVLTSLQVMMVSGIIYTSGRELKTKLALEFIASLGANITLGLLLREGSRAALKFLPGWGHLVSGAVAGAGTYALGRAATAYYIEGLSLKDARSVFRKGKKKAVVPELQDRPPSVE